MTRPSNDNDRAIVWGSRVGPRDESAPYATTIGMEVQAPLTDERMALALETLEDGLSVLVLGASLQEANDTAWELIKAMSPVVATI